MSSSTDAPARRADYPHASAIPTRWKDNDVYGHVNNIEYYGFFDTVINEYLIRAGGLDIHAGDVIGLCAESHCSYHAALSFPDTVDACLRVGRLGRSSVTYELALFPQGQDDAAATGWFVHVFVDRDTRRPVQAMPDRLRTALQALATTQETPT